MKVTKNATSNFIDKGKIKPMSSDFISIPNSVPFINNQEERPLKQNHQDLSFKGLSISTFDNVAEVVKKFGEEFGTEAAKNFEKQIEQAHNIKNIGLTRNGNSITFTEQSVPKRFLDTLTFPFTQMPVDIVNATIQKLQKIPGLKNSGLLNKIADKNFLKNRRLFKESTANVYGIHNYFDYVKANKSGFAAGQKRFKSINSNYASYDERALTRFVTGAIPAFFLANDAYNLTIYMSNNKEEAKKAKKRRFNQEAIRIIITAVASFSVLKTFAKASNKNAMMANALLCGVTAVSEIAGRMMAGTPVLPVNKQQAIKYAQKQGKLQNKNNSDDKTQNDKAQTEQNKDAKSKDKKKKGVLTFENALKVALGLVAFGFVFDKAKTIKPIKEFVKNNNDKYKDFLNSDFIISREEFNRLTKKLRENGFDKMAEKYEELIKDKKGDSINLGRTLNPTKELLINNILTFPIRYTWSVIKMPYNIILKTIEFFKKSAAKEEPVKEFGKNQLINSLQFLKKIEKKDNFKELVNSRILDSFDNVSKSNYSNADKAASFRSTQQAVTSAFLIADNYNMVMIDSQGNDQDLAEQKAKERTIQRVVRIIYGAMLNKLFNNAFAGLYNGSLLGAQVVNVGNVMVTETLERKSVGLPTHEATREEIIEADNKNLEAKGIKGDYYRFMSKLTGKKPITKKQDKN